MGSVQPMGKVDPNSDYYDIAEEGVKAKKRKGGLANKQNSRVFALN
jgi:hypothetical protein